MGIRLVEEVMDHAPDSLTTGEWKGLVVLARDANDDTRLTYHGVNSPEILRRVRMSIAAWSNLRSALIRKGVLEVVTAGTKGHSAVYRIPPLAVKNLHPTDEESSPDAADLHLSDEELGADLHPVDEASPGFFIQQMTPTPLSAPQPLSPPRRDLPTETAPDPPRERTDPPPTPDAQAVLDAYAAALGRPVTNGTRAKLLGHAAHLLATGHPAAWLADRAREMAPKGWTDLEQHAARSTVPIATPARAAPSGGLPPWCGQCGGGADAARVNPKFRTLNGHPAAQRCPRCHPDAQPSTEPRRTT